MGKVYRGESENPYGMGSTIYYQWEAEHLKAWIKAHHQVVHVAETKCNGVVCLVDEDSLKEIL